MKSSLRNWLLVLLAAASTCLAAADEEPGDPLLVPPGDPMETYDSSLLALEQLVDGYFLAALRDRRAVSSNEFARLNDAMREYAESLAGERPGRVLTAREFMLRAKIVILRELDPRFAGEDLPADVTQELNALASIRPAVIDRLVEEGAW